MVGQDDFRSIREDIERILLAKQVESESEKLDLRTIHEIEAFCSGLAQRVEELEANQDMSGLNEELNVRFKENEIRLREMTQSLEKVNSEIDALLQINQNVELKVEEKITRRLQPLIEECVSQRDQKSERLASNFTQFEKNIKKRIEDVHQSATQMINSHSHLNERSLKSTEEYLSALDQKIEGIQASLESMKVKQFGMGMDMVDKIEGFIDERLGEATFDAKLRSLEGG